jgi:hypothetical protein
MTTEAILRQLDDCAEKFTFPMLDNGYVYPADGRINIYRSVTDWLMIIEVLGTYSPRVSAYDSFQNCLHLFGSAREGQPATSNENFLYPISGCPDAPLFEDKYEWFAKDDARCVIVRGTRISLDLTEARLAEKGIELLEKPLNDPVAILRSLLPEHRLLLLASDDELAKRNPENLPLFLRIDEWNHPDLANGEKPSESETFQMLARAIETGNRSAYQPTKPPNTYWKNWPEGGTL